MKAKTKSMSERRRAWVESPECRSNLEKFRMRGVMQSARQRVSGAVRGVDPAVAKLGEIMRRNAGLNKEYVRRAGLKYHQIQNWTKRGTSPRLHMIRAALNAYGYDLAVVRLKGRDDEDAETTAPDAAD